MRIRVKARDELISFYQNVGQILGTNRIFAPSPVANVESNTKLEANNLKTGWMGGGY